MTRIFLSNCESVETKMYSLSVNRLDPQMEGGSAATGDRYFSRFHFDLHQCAAVPNETSNARYVSQINIPRPPPAGTKSNGLPFPVTKPPLFITNKFLA